MGPAPVSSLIHDVGEKRAERFRAKISPDRKAAQICPLGALARSHVMTPRDRLSVGLVSGPVAGRGFGMPFLASSLDELTRSGLSCE